MIISQSPTFSQTFQNGSQVQDFDYNLLPVRSNVTMTVQSEQAQIVNIRNSGIGDNAVVDLNDDILAYLNDVQAQSGALPVIYIADNTGTFPNYTGSYTALFWQNLSGMTSIRIQNTNGNASYQGDKSFAGATTSQLLYRYGSYSTIQYYNTTLFGHVRANIQVLNTQTQTLLSNGSLQISLSEAAKPYTPPTGVFTLQVIVTEYDFLGEVSQVTSDYFNFVNSSLQQINYGNYSLFNPNDGGSLLPSTGWKLLYNTNEVYPFFLNFVVNEVISQFTTNSIILILSFQNIQSEEIGTAQIDISSLVNIGLNCLDISQLGSAFLSELNLLKPYKISVKLKYGGYNAGQWASSDFVNTDWVVSDEYYSSLSGSFEFLCKFYQLNNRRDFYFWFDSGWGGQSTFNAKMYEKENKPDILQLRNEDALSNNVVRASEYYDITMRFLDLQEVRFLNGNDLEFSSKQDAIYESEVVVRYDAFGIQTNWLIEPQSYKQNNTELFKDIVFRVVRANFQNTITVLEPTVSISSIVVTGTTAVVTCNITYRGIEPVLQRGVLFDGTFETTLLAQNPYTVTLTGLSTGETYSVNAQIVSPTSTILSSTKTFNT